MTKEETNIIEAITEIFLQNKATWDLKTQNEQQNTSWVKWVPVHSIASKIKKKISETQSLLLAMEKKGLVVSKKQINHQFYSCSIPGFRQHKTEKDYYCLEL